MKTYLFLSCLLLGAGISMSPLADTRVVDALWGPSKMEVVLSSSAAFLYIVFGEYLIHRFVLHGRVFGDNKWRREHLHHHIVGDNDHWFGPSVIGGLLASSPLFAVIFHFTGIYGFIWSCCVVLTYLYFSKAVHQAVHQPHFLRQMPWHNLISKHHEAHHLRPNCNFSLLFPFVDRVFQKREKTLSRDIKPYLFFFSLLLGTGISISSLMADTHVVNASSCNDARFGACTSAQTSLTTDEVIRPRIRTTRSMPPSITDAYVVNVPYSEANSHKNDVVRWGGLITDIKNEENHRLIQVEFYPLDESGYPQLDQPSDGEFVIKTPEFMDLEINYLKHSEITVVGALNGYVKPIWTDVDGNDVVSMPLIVLSEHEKYSYIWSISKDLYRDADYSTLIEVINIADPRFLTTSDDRSLLAEILVIAGKTVVVTAIAAAIFVALGAGGRPI